MENMKKCNTCHKTKPVSEFYLNLRDKMLRGYCKLCSHNFCKNYRNSPLGKAHKKKISQKGQEQRMSFCNELKTITKCTVCQEFNAVCLDFHHIDPTLKERMVTGISTWSGLLAEAKKCTVLCANCHRKAHAGLILPVFDCLSIPDDLIKKYIKQPHKVKGLK